MYAQTLRATVMRGLVAVTAVLAIVALAACGGSSSGGGSSASATSPSSNSAGGSSSASASAGLMTPGTLQVGMNLQFKPEAYLDNGKPAGYDVDVVKQLAKYLGVKYKIDNLDFNGLIPGLQSKKFDMVVAGLTPTPDRKKAVDFSDSYIPYADILAVPTSDNQPAQISTYNKSSVKITVLQGSSEQQLVGQVFPNAQVVALPDQNATLLDVQTGRAQASVLTDYLLVQFNNVNGNKLKEAPLSKPIQVNYGSWAVQKGNTTLTKRLNAFICKSENDGLFAKLYKKNFDTTIAHLPSACG